jgi:hypothetical protein
VVAEEPGFAAANIHCRVQVITPMFWPAGPISFYKLRSFHPVRSNDVIKVDFMGVLTAEEKHFAIPPDRRCSSVSRLGTVWVSPSRRGSPNRFNGQPNSQANESDAYPIIFHLFLCCNAFTEFIMVYIQVASSGSSIESNDKYRPVRYNYENLPGGILKRLYQ